MSEQKLREALEIAKRALYNGFEPDNQSRAYKVVCEALAQPTSDEGTPLTDDTAKTLREWADKELFGTNVNRESHLGYIAAREIERLRALGEKPVSTLIEK